MRRDAGLFIDAKRRYTVKSVRLIRHDGRAYGWSSIASQLEAKFADLANGILPPATVRRAMDACWNIENLPPR